jgi:uncharacterized protein YprB with RNaseH-like and TPR domain
MTSSKKKPVSRGVLRTSTALARKARKLSSEAPPLKTPKGRLFSDERNARKILNPLRVAVFDIETTGLNASFGRVLCAAIQFYGPDSLEGFRADQYKEWKEGKRADDKELVADILASLEKADVVIAHNGVNFDMAFLRTRALIHGLPPVHPKKIVDPVLIARKVFRFHSNSLDSIAAMIGTDFMKTPVAPQYWIKALADGDKESLDYIMEHCIKDVYVLEEVARKIMPYARQIDAIGSWR